MKQFAYYYQEIESIGQNDDIPSLIKLHEESFERYGWEVVRVNEETARQHPKYDLFDDPCTPLGWSKNLWRYTRACYMRWLAYSVVGGYFADFDVINYGFSQQEAEDIVGLRGLSSPIFLSLAGAIGLANSEGHEKIIQTYVDFIERPATQGIMDQDVNDMTIMRQLHPEWYDYVPYNDDCYCKDYTNPGWETAKLVHYPYFFTKSPRIDVVRSVRPK